MPTSKQFSDSPENTVTSPQDGTFNPATVLFPKRKTKSSAKNANKKYSPRAKKPPVRPRMGACSLPDSQIQRPHAHEQATRARVPFRNNKGHCKSNIKRQPIKSMNVSHRPGARSPADSQCQSSLVKKQMKRVKFATKTVVYEFNKRMPVAKLKGKDMVHEQNQDASSRQKSETRTVSRAATSTLQDQIYQDPVEDTLPGQGTS